MPNSLLERLHQRARHGRAAADDAAAATRCRPRVRSQRRRACRSRSSAPRRRSVGLLGLDDPRQRLGLQEPVRASPGRRRPCSAAYGMPHALAWNIGTIAQHRSSLGTTARACSSSSTASECRYDRPVASRRRPSGCRWCRSCSTSPRRTSRPRRASRTPCGCRGEQRRRSAATALPADSSADVSPSPVDDHVLDGLQLAAAPARAAGSATPSTMTTLSSAWLAM